MSKRSCEYCKYLTDGCRCKARDERIISSTLFECGCIHFEESKQTVFDHITQSEETLAEKLVYFKERIFPDDIWESTLFFRQSFYSKEEAIAATVEELKKEYKK